MSTRRLAAFINAGLFLLILNGCSPKAEEEKGSTPKSEEAVPKVKVAPETPKETPKGAVEAPTGKVVSFRESVLLDPPDGELRPPDKTAAGKSVPGIYEAISAKGGLWENIPFVTAEGKKIRYMADVKTDLGTIRIELFSDEAPNHVRNFVALARAGYYNGLSFHRTLNQESMGKAIAYLEAGCPKGTGEVGYGSIGYWLKPEIHPKHSHDEGAAHWHAEELETAACRFYVTLSKAPWMNGNYTIFGKIVSGLDVARTINTRPIQDDEFKDRPVNPVIIREVAIQTTVLD